MVYNPNNEGQLPSEFVEKRPMTEGNSGQATVIETQGAKIVHTYSDQRLWG